MTTIEMQVHMCCPGCESKIKKALEKLKGVDSIDIDMNLQKVTVTGWADQKKVLKIVRKTGRRAEIWQIPYNPELRNLNQGSHNYDHQHHYSGPAAYNGAQPSAGSSYNYYKHGYSGHGLGNYYQHSGHSSAVFGNQTGAAFSDENPNACSVM